MYRPLPVRLSRVVWDIASRARRRQATYVFPGEPEANYGRWVMPVIPRAMSGLPRTYLIRGTKT